MMNYLKSFALTFFLSSTVFIPLFGKIQQSPITSKETPIGTCDLTLQVGLGNWDAFIKKSTDSLGQLIQSLTTFYTASNEGTYFIDNERYLKCINLFTCIYGMLEQSKAPKIYLENIKTCKEIAEYIYKNAKLIVKINPETKKVEYKRQVPGNAQEIRKYALAKLAWLKNVVNKSIAEIDKSVDLSKEWKSNVQSNSSKAFPGYTTFFKKHNEYLKDFENTDENFELWLHAMGLKNTKSLEVLINQLEELNFALSTKFFFPDKKTMDLSKKLSLQLMRMYNFDRGFASRAFYDKLKNSPNKAAVIMYYSAIGLGNVLRKFLDTL